MEVLIVLLLVLGVLGAGAADTSARIEEEPGVVVEPLPMAAAAPAVPAVRVPPRSPETCERQRNRPRQRDLTVPFAARGASTYLARECTGGNLDE